MRRLSRAGFKKDFVRPAILPDWWDDSCTNDPRLLQDVELRISRFLGLPLTRVTDSRSALSVPDYPQAQLRRVRDIDRDRLAPAIHAATKIAAAVVRSLRDPDSPVELPPQDGLAWRDEINRSCTGLILTDIVTDLWKRGIPVVPLDVLPSPSFQGIACVVENRPVVALAHKHDAPGRVAFFVAHEAGHVAFQDCASEQPVIDEDEEITDNAEIEVRADTFATRVIFGNDSIPTIEGADFKELARSAINVERTTGADASSLIFAWARISGDHATATMAVKALYRGTGARMQLRKCFDSFVDLETATDSDRALLRCVYGEPEPDEASG